MYKNHLPNVKTYYHHLLKEQTKCMDNRLVPNEFVHRYFVNPKYLYSFSKTFSGNDSFPAFEGLVS